MALHLGMMSGTSMDDAPGASLYVCGGGARNAALLSAVAALIAPSSAGTVTGAKGARILGGVYRYA